MQFWFYLLEVYIYWVALENAGPTLCDTVDPRKTITADFSQLDTMLVSMSVLLCF